MGIVGLLKDDMLQVHAALTFNLRRLRLHVAYLLEGAGGCNII